MKKGILGLAAASILYTGCGPNPDTTDTNVTDNNVTDINNTSEQIKERLSLFGESLKNFIFDQEKNLDENISKIINENIKNIDKYYKEKKLEIDFKEFEDNFSELNNLYKNAFFEVIKSEKLEVNFFLNNMKEISSLNLLGKELLTNFKDDNGNTLLFPITSIIEIQTFLEENNYELNDFNENFNKLKKTEKLTFYNILKLEKKEKIKTYLDKIFKKEELDYDEYVNLDDFGKLSDFLKNNNSIKLVKQETDNGNAYYLKTDNFAFELSFSNTTNLEEGQKNEIYNIVNILTELEKIKKNNKNFEYNQENGTLDFGKIKFKSSTLEKFNQDKQEEINFDIFHNKLLQAYIINYILENNKNITIENDNGVINENESFYDYIYFEGENFLIYSSSLDESIDLYLYDKLENKYIFDDNYNLRAQRIKDEKLEVYNKNGENSISKTVPNKDITQSMVKGEYTRKKLKEIYNKYYEVKNPTLEEIKYYNKLQKYVNDGTNKDNPFIKGTPDNIGETFENPYSLLINPNNDCDGWAVDGKHVIESLKNQKGISNIDTQIVVMLGHATLFFDIVLENGNHIYGTYGTFGVEIINVDDNGELKKIHNFENIDFSKLEGVDENRKMQSMQKLWEKYYWTDTKNIIPTYAFGTTGFIAKDLNTENGLKEFKQNLSSEEIKKIKWEIFQNLYRNTDIPMSVDNSTKLNKLGRLVDYNIEGQKSPLYDLFSIYVDVKDLDGNRLEESNLNVFKLENGNIGIDLEELSEDIKNKIRLFQSYNESKGLSLTDLNDIFYNSGLDGYEKNQVLFAIKYYGLKKIQEEIYNNKELKKESFYFFIKNLKGENLDNFIKSFDDFNFLNDNYENYILYDLSNKNLEYIISKITDGKTLIDILYRISGKGISIDKEKKGIAKEYITSGEEFKGFIIFQIFYSYLAEEDFSEYINEKNINYIMKYEDNIKYYFYGEKLTKIYEKLYDILDYSILEKVLEEDRQGNIYNYSNKIIISFINNYIEYTKKTEQIKDLLSDNIANLYNLDDLISLYQELNLVDLKNVKASIQKIIDNDQLKLTTIIEEIINDKINNGNIKELFEKAENILDISIFSEKENYKKGTNSYILIQKILKSDGILDIIKTLKNYNVIREYYKLEETSSK